jgi:spore maturation protein CgeB
MQVINKVLVVGAFSQDSNAYTYATTFHKTFQKLGYQVDTFNTRKNWGLFKEVNTHFCNVFLQRKVLEFKPDMVFFVKAENVYSKTVRQLKNKFKTLLVNFYPDNPFVLWNGNSNSQVLKSLPFYDCYLSWSKQLMSSLESAGCKKVYYFPFAYDKHLFDSMKSTNNNHVYDICFVGTWEPDREKWLTQICKKLPDLKMAIWGNMWNENLASDSILRKHLKGKAIYGEQMIKAFRASKIVLNFIRKQNLTAHNMRTFEVPASGAFLLTERTYEQASFLFKEDESVACFKDIEELVKKIKMYLKIDTLRNEIARRGQDRAKLFTMERVLGEFMDSLGEGFFDRQKK